MFPPEIISKLGLIETPDDHTMYSAYMNIYVSTLDHEGRRLPERVFMTRQTIQEETVYDYTSASRILMGKDLAAFLN